jgi:hypothetical protein
VNFFEGKICVMYFEQGSKKLNGDVAEINVEKIKCEPLFGFYQRNVSIFLLLEQYFIV